MGDRGPVTALSIGGKISAVRSMLKSGPAYRHERRRHAGPIDVHARARSAGMGLTTRGDPKAGSPVDSLIHPDAEAGTPKIIYLIGTLLRFQEFVWAGVLPVSGFPSSMC